MHDEDERVVETFRLCYAFAAGNVLFPIAESKKLQARSSGQSRQIKLIYLIHCYRRNDSDENTLKKVPPDYSEKNILLRSRSFQDSAESSQLQLRKICRENSKLSFFASLLFMADGGRMLGEQRMLQESQQRGPLSVCAALPSPLLCRPRVRASEALRSLPPTHGAVSHDVPARADAEENLLREKGWARIGRVIETGSVIVKPRLPEIAKSPRGIARA